MTLYAPNTYWEADKTIKKKITNGCGAKKGIKQ